MKQQKIWQHIRESTGINPDYLQYYEGTEIEFWQMYKQQLIKELKEGLRKTIMQEEIKTPYKRQILISVNKELNGIEIYSDNNLTTSELTYIKDFYFKWNREKYLFWRKYDKDIFEKLKIYFNKEDVILIIDNENNIKLKTKHELEQAILKLLKETKGDISREAIISILKDSNPKII